MADDYVINESTGVFPNNRRADVMRNSMENKNLLVNKGAIYVGTGSNTPMNKGNNESTYVARTSCLNPPVSGGNIINDEIIVTNSSATNGLEYRLLSDTDVRGSSYVYSTINNVSGLSNGFRSIVITNVLPSSPSNDIIYFVVEA